MTELFLMTPGHRFWEETASLAENCSWKAGPFLSEKMNSGPFLPWERVCAARVDGKIVGFCTFLEKDELPDTFSFSPFIGFVFVEEAYRGNRLSEWMIQRVITYARELGFKNIYIMSGEVGFYEKYGFTKLGDYPTIYGSVDQLFMMEI